MGPLAELVRPNFFAGILAVFTGLLGFYITNVVEGLRSGYTAIHYFEPDKESDSVFFHLVNVSRTKRIDAARFELRCADQNELCFKGVSDSDPGLLVSAVVTPPNYGKLIDIGESGFSSVQVCLGAIASSRTSVRVVPRNGKNTPLIALYDPWSESCAPARKDATNLLLLSRYDPHAFFARNYFTMITGALALSAAFFIIMGISKVVQGFRMKKGASDEKADIPAEELVFLSFRTRHPDDGPGG